MGSRALFAVACASVLSGCGASTVRVEVAPTVDTGGHVGVESLFSLGVGMPLDYDGRSHHYLQGLGALGGGREGRSGAGEFVAAAGVDYIYWAEPRLDLRAGARFAYRQIPDDSGGTHLYGLGAHLGLMPMVKQDNSNWLVAHLCLGPDLRIETVWSDATSPAWALVSLPLVLELNLLAAGD